MALVMEKFSKERRTTLVFLSDLLSSGAPRSFYTPGGRGEKVGETFRFSLSSWRGDSTGPFRVCTLYWRRTGRKIRGTRGTHRHTEVQ